LAQVTWPGDEAQKGSISIKLLLETRLESRFFELLIGFLAFLLVEFGKFCTLFNLQVLEEAKLKCGDVVITPNHIDLMENMTIAVFEILERVWKTKVRSCFTIFCVLKNWCFSKNV